MLHDFQCTGSMAAPATLEKEEDTMAEKKEVEKKAEETEVTLATEKKKDKKEFDSRVYLRNDTPQSFAQ